MADLFYEKKSCGNNLQFVDELINNMIEILILYASDDFWKLLKYGTKDALTNDTYTVTIGDKVALSTSNIKLIQFSDDISTVEHNEIRIYENGWNGTLQNDFDIVIGFDVICGKSIDTLDTDEQHPLRERATNILRNELLDLFNGARISRNIGTFNITRQRGLSRRFNDNYIGTTFTLLGVSG